MGAADELRDPPGVAVAVGAVGVAAGTGLPPSLALGVGVAVLATKVATALLLDRRREAAEAAPPVATGPPGADEPPVAPEPAAAAPAPAPAAPAATAAPPANVFRPEGEYWTIAYRGSTFRLKDAKGLRHLHRMLAEPGREFHVSDLAPTGGESDAGAVLDPAAKEAYRRRLEDLRDEAEEARSWGDAEREARAEDEIAALAHELAGAVGLHGKDRRAVSPTERARVNVTRAVKSSIERIAEHDRSLGHHLASTVRTGTYCAYVPDPDDTPVWQL